MMRDDDTNDRLWDALYSVMSTTGLDPRTIALKAIVPLDELEPFLEDSGHDLSDDTAMRLAVFASKALKHPLGMALAMLREAAQMSLGDVEAATGITRTSVSKYERGERVPGVEALLSLHRCYQKAIPESGVRGSLNLEAVAAGDLGAVKAWIDKVVR